MGDHDHDKLRELAEAATPGPWEIARVNGYLRVYAPHGALGDVAVAGDMMTMDLGTARYIAAASPSTILSLLDALKAATERAARAERELDEAVARAKADENWHEALRQKIWDLFPEMGADHLDAEDLLDNTRAELTRIEKERDEERHLATVRGEMLTKAEAERDEAIEDRNLARDDAARAAALLAARTIERDEARAERDALQVWKCSHCLAMGRGPCEPACIGDSVSPVDTLRAHARKAVEP